MDSAEGPLIEGIHTQRMKERKMGKINTKDATGRTVTLTRVRVSFADSLDVASLPKKTSTT